MKIKELDESEQKEKQIENYKMMSAISGRNINDFIGDSHKSNYNEKDCLIKQLFLKHLVDPISSDELYNALKSKGYTGKPTTFRGLLNRYQKYKYVQKVNNKKPFLYQITQLGNEHIKNPYLAREESIRRYKEFQLQKLKEIIESKPEVFKNIYESIHGTQNSPFYAGNVVSGGSLYSGATERIEEYRDKINDDGFLQNVNKDKIKELIELGDPELLTDFYINLNDYYKKHKSSMTLKTPEYQSSKPIGERNYYEYLIKAIDKPVTRSLYESLPFRFIYIPNKNQIRLESEVIAGKYRNNEDGRILDFDYVLRNVFQNRMIVKVQKNDNELIFFYTDGYTNYKITTMSSSDYEKTKSKTNSSLKIIKN